MNPSVGNDQVLTHATSLFDPLAVCVCVWAYKQEADADSLASSKKSIMALSDGGKLFRAELEIVLCKEPPV